MPDELDAMVKAACRTRRLGVYPLVFTLVDDHGDPVEQYFRVDGEALTPVQVPTINYRCGNQPSRGADLSVAAAGATAVIHTHPFGTDPNPGGGDSSIPRAWHVPVYGISPINAWCVDPGPPIRVREIAHKLHGFDQRDWERKANSPVKGRLCVPV